MTQAEIRIVNAFINKGEAIINSPKKGTQTARFKGVLLEGEVLVLEHSVLDDGSVTICTDDGSIDQDIPQGSSKHFVVGECDVYISHRAKSEKLIRREVI